MGRIPQQLISAFMELGLLESEAKIYSALVLFHDAEVKELQEFLDISKPSIYEGLRTLEDHGFIVLTNDKPTTYQAIPPEIVLDMLMNIHLRAKDEALILLKKLEKEKFADDAPPNLWYIFGPKSFESKIKDMLENAKESVVCLTTDKYLAHIERCAKSDVRFELTVVSEKDDSLERIKKIFKNGNLRSRRIGKDDAINILAPFKAGYRTEMIPAMSETLGMFDFENVLIIVVDDKEMLYIPPIPDASLNAMVSKNMAFIRMMELLIPIVTPKESP